MIRRQTVWTSDRGAIQVSVAILDNDWDVLIEDTVEVGPFDALHERVELLDHRLREWLHSVGIQQSLL